MRTFLIENVYIYAKPENHAHIQRVLHTLCPDLGKLENDQWHYETQIEVDLDEKDLVIVDYCDIDLRVGSVLEAISNGAVFMQWMNHGALSVWYKGKQVDSGHVEQGEVSRFKKCRFKAIIPPVEPPVSS